MCSGCETILAFFSSCIIIMHSLCARLFQLLFFFCLLIIVYITYGGIKCADDVRVKEILFLPLNLVVSMLQCAIRNAGKSRAYVISAIKIDLSFTRSFSFPLSLPLYLSHTLSIPSLYFSTPTGLYLAQWTTEISHNFFLSNIITSK